MSGIQGMSQPQYMAMQPPQSQPMAAPTPQSLMHLATFDGQTTPGQMQMTKFQNLAGHLQGLFAEFETSRQTKESEWLEDVRHFHGQYDANTAAKLAAQPNKSRVFHNLTKTKVITAYARIIDIYFSNPLSDFWSIDSTPVPDLPEDARQKVVQQAVSEVVTISGRHPSDPEILPLIKERVAELQDQHASEWTEAARESADAMTKEVRDLLEESNAEDEIKQAILECCNIGTGCIAGVQVAIDETKRWQVDLDGIWQLVSHKKVAGRVEMVSCFETYPDPHCVNPRKLERLFHRKIMTRSEIETLRNQPGFFASEVDGLLMSNPNGNHVYKPWEQELNNLAGVTTFGSSNKYEVLIYWGKVSGELLAQHGFNVDRSQSQNMVVFMAGGYILGVRHNPSPRGKLPYNFFPYELSTHRFWGVGVSRSIRDSQIVMNSMIRMFIDNTALSSGPIVEVNTDLIDPAELSTVHQIYPWRVFKRKGGEDNSPAVRFYQPRTISNHILKLLEMMRRFADEESNLPSYTHGQSTPGLNKTASGMSMLMSASNVALKSVIKNIDMFGIKPTMQSAVDHVMQFGTNPLAKSGDINVTVHASSTLVAKELQSQRMMQFMGMTANPVDGQVVKRHKLLRSVAKSLDIDPDEAILSDDEYEQFQRAQQGNAGTSAVLPTNGPQQGSRAIH